MDAIVFDFDGVIVDSEPLHYEGFARALQSVDIPLKRDDYYTSYLGYDDHDCFHKVAQDLGRDLDEQRIRQLIDQKSRWMQKTLQETIEPLPGAVALIRKLSDQGVPLAICSGALREEIQIAARRVGVLDCFRLIVSARDVEAGKPDPEGYAKALSLLSQDVGKPLAPERSLAIEDSPAGIASARSAGLSVLAVTTSYPARELSEASRIVNSLEDVDADELRTLCDAAT